MPNSLINLAKKTVDSDYAKTFLDKNVAKGNQVDGVDLLDPEDPVWGSRYRLADLEQKALDPVWAAKNPELATLNYPGFSESARARRQNEGPGAIFRNFVNPYLVQPALKGLAYTTQFGPAGSAAATGGAGYLGGKALDALLNKAGIDSRFDILLGLLGAGAGYAMSKNSNYTPVKTLSMKKTSSFYKFGQAIGFVSQNVPVSEGYALAAKDETLNDVRTPGYGVMQKNVCKLAADMYSFTNQKHKLEYHIFEKLANANRWSNLLDPYVDAVYESLTRLHSKNAFDINAAIKSSSSILNLFTGLATRGAMMSPDALKTLLGLSAATGGSLGVATWLANRHAKQDVTKNEELKQKIDYYNMVTDELSNQLKAKGLIVSEEDPEAKDKQLV